VEPSRQPLVRSQVQSQESEPSRPKICENSWVGGVGVARPPKKSDPAYLAVSRVSLGRGYLDALGKWPSTRLGGELFSKDFGFVPWGMPGG